MKLSELEMKVGHELVRRLLGMPRGPGNAAAMAILMAFDIRPEYFEEEIIIGLTEPEETLTQRGVRIWVGTGVFSPKKQENVTRSLVKTCEYLGDLGIADAKVLSCHRAWPP